MRRRGPLAAFFAFGLLWGSWAVLVPAVQLAVGASKGELGLALVFVAVGSVPAMLLAGRAVDRYGTRILPWLLLGLGAAAVLPGLAGSLPLLAAGLVVLGSASGATDVAMNATVSALEERRDARLMQLAHAGYAGGVLVGALATGVAREAGIGRAAILLAVGVAIAASAGLNLRHEGGPAEAAARRPGLSRAAIPFGIACAAAFAVEGGLESWSALFLERELDAGPAAGSLAPAAFGAAMLIGRLGGQWLEARLSDTALLAGAAVVAAAGLVGAAAAPNVPLAVAAFFVGGAGISIAAPALFGAGARNATRAERGAALATVTTIGYLGFLVGPPVVGGLAEAVGLRASFVALALVAVALAAVTPRLPLGR